MRGRDPAGRRAGRARLSPLSFVPLALLAVLLTTAGGGEVLSGLTARVANSQDTHATGTLFLRSVRGATTQCDATPAGATIPATATFPCTGATYPSAVPGSGTATAQITLSDLGTVTPSSATYATTSALPIQLQNTRAPSDPMLVRGGVTYAQAGPLSGSASLGVDGSTALAGSVVSGTAPASQSVAVWFKTTTSTGGTLVGFGNSPTYQAQTLSDRMLWMTNAGRIGFGVGLSNVLGVISDQNSVTGTTAYNDGQWHMAVGVLSTVTLLGVGYTRAALYVDGAFIAQSDKLLVLGAPASFAGYWHVGWSPAAANGWTTGSSAYFNGALANATLFPSALTAANVTTLYGSASQSAWAANAATLAASSAWPLGDDGKGTYAGTVPGLAAAPATMVAVTVGGSGFCAYPNLPSTSCAAPAGTATLATLAAAGSQAFPPSAPGAPVALTTTVARGPTYDATYAQRLHLLLPVTITEQRGGFANTLTWSGNDLVI